MFSLNRKSAPTQATIESIKIEITLNNCLCEVEAEASTSDITLPIVQAVKHMAKLFKSPWI